MDRHTEVSLIKECLNLERDGSGFLHNDVYRVPVSYYQDPERFDAETKQVFTRQPLYACHANELPEVGSFVARKMANNYPLLMVKDRQGHIRAFANVCRHRGAKLVPEGTGCQQRFTCPYHAWTYKTDGRLMGAPQFDEGFPGLEKSEIRLHELPCLNVNGLVFVGLDQAPASGGEETQDDVTSTKLEAFFPQALKDDLDWMTIADLHVFKHHSKVWQCNWKILLEGGLESYHFTVAHAKTIGPYFLNNKSTWQVFGNHQRSVLPKKNILKALELPESKWDIRYMTHLLYTLFPNLAILAQPDHVALLAFTPLAVDQTRIDTFTIVPPSNSGGKSWTADETAHWQRNHDLTVATLAEDFEIGEGIQTGLSSNANDALTFARFESGLSAFHHIYESQVSLI